MLCPKQQIIIYQYAKMVSLNSFQVNNNLLTTVQSFMYLRKNKRRERY